VRYIPKMLGCGDKCPYKDPRVDGDDMGSR
jgi:hypothetical protein